MLVFDGEEYKLVPLTEVEKVFKDRETSYVLRRVDKKPDLKKMKKSELIELIEEIQSE